MIPRSPTREKGRCGRMLSVTVLGSLVAIASCGTTPVFQLQQTPAQDRGGGGGGGGWMDSFASLNPFASAPAPPAYNIPDVAGFGMYPLWKFHKFDGLSLRPVPYGVDIGKGLPVPPDPPTNPISFYSGPSPAGNGPPMKNSYGAASAYPPATNYEQSPPSQPPNPYSYSPPAAPPSYPQQNPQVLNYMPSGPPQYPAPEAPPANYGQQAPVTLSYQPAQKYNEPSYNAPASAPSYEPQAYAPAANPSYGAPMNPPAAYDGGGMGGITIQFSAPASQDYGMQQQQPSYGSSSPQGSYQMPAYSAIENPMTVSYQPVADSKPMDSYNSGGYYKRSSFENEANKKMSSEDGIISSDGSFQP